MNANRPVWRGVAATRLATLLVVLLAALAQVASAAPATASCAGSRSVTESLLVTDVVVVGTVTHIENDGRWVTVHVEERWRAPRTLPDTIEVRGGPEPGAATTIDRFFTEGRYLFFLTDGPGYFSDDACSGTVAWTDELAAFRPAGVSPAPDVVADAPPGPLDQLDVLPVVALLAALGIALLSYLTILRGRLRPPDWMR